MAKRKKKEKVEEELVFKAKVRFEIEYPWVESDFKNEKAWKKFKKEIKTTKGLRKWFINGIDPDFLMGYLIGNVDKGKIKIKVKKG